LPRPDLGLEITSEGGLVGVFGVKAALLGVMTPFLGVMTPLLGVAAPDMGCRDEGAGVGTLDEGLLSVGLIALLGVLLFTEVLLTPGSTLTPPTGVFTPLLSLEKGRA